MLRCLTFMLAEKVEVIKYNGQVQPTEVGEVG